VKRALSKQGPQTEFAWLVEEGVRAYQRAKRKPTLEGAEAELSGSLGIGIRTLQAWRHAEQPTDCNLVLAFVKLCVEASPTLGQRWVTDLLRAADMAPYAGAAIREVFGASGVQPDALAMLADQIIEADAVFQRVRVDEFVGREWLTARLDAFLNEPARRYGVFLLVGEAGVGKTSFLAHLVRERGYLYLFAEQAPGEANLSLALRSLAAQLATRYQIPDSTGFCG
jgi:hypothetical protein